MHKPKIYTDKNVAISGMHKPKIYTDKNVAINGMHKPQMHWQICSNQWHAETLNNEYRHKNVETSDAQIQKKVDVGSFVCMKENTTAVTKSYQMKLLQSYRRWISHSWEVYPEEKRTKTKKKEMENDNMALYHMRKKTCHGKQQWGDV